MRVALDRSIVWLRSALAIMLVVGFVAGSCGQEPQWRDARQEARSRTRQAGVGITAPRVLAPKGLVGRCLRSGDAEGRWSIAPGLDRRAVLAELVASRGAARALIDDAELRGVRVTCAEQGTALQLRPLWYSSARAESWPTEEMILYIEHGSKMREDPPPLAFTAVVDRMEAARGESVEIFLIE